MVKQKIVKRMTWGGFIGFILIQIIKSLGYMVMGILAIIPILNLPLIYWWNTMDSGISSFIEDGNWDYCKSKFKVIKQVKIRERVIEEILQEV